MVDVAIDSQSNGKIVRSGELGSLRISLSSNGSATVEEFEISDNKGYKVLFSPGKRIKEMTGNINYWRS